MKSQRKGFVCGLAILSLGGVTPSMARSAEASDAAGSRWGKNYFPNIPLITHEGKKVHFFDDLIKDKVVMINFIYTTCPDSCPLETAQLLEVQRILGDRVGRDVFMYSISIDPKRDTPEVLKDYVELYGVGPGWTFLTGEEADITLLRKRLGLYIPEIQNGSLDHNLSMIIGNQTTGRWRKSSPFENPYVLAEQIGGWLHNWKMPPKEKLDYSHAPELRPLSEGENLYRTRCAACHTIGGGDIVKPEERRVGPDLLGVVQMRDRSWLSRWLAEPEKVLQDKDPIAMGLLAKYNNLPMPNMRLNKREVDSLIEYLGKESRRVENVKRIKAIAAIAAEGKLGACCSKKENEEKKDTVMVADAIELERAEGNHGEIPEPQSQRSGYVTAPMTIFGVLGLAFLFLARVLRRVV